MLLRVKVSANALCPCGRDAKLKQCCARYHRGRPASPPALVRARYTAYVLGQVRFIIDTTHPTAPHYVEDRSAWRAQLAAYCQRVSFEGLRLHEHEIDQAQGRATVRFTVALRDEGRPAGFTERSLFLRDGNRWRYVSGEIEPSRPAEPEDHVFTS